MMEKTNNNNNNVQSKIQIIEKQNSIKHKLKKAFTRIDESKITRTKVL